MPATYTWPLTPRPSVVHAPEVIDAVLHFQVDAGYEVRRARTSRPRRRWTMEYLGLDVDQMHIIRDFVQAHRVTALAFQWFHPTAVELATYLPYPAVSALVYRHGLASGMWVGVSNSPNPNLNGGTFPILRQDTNVAIIEVAGVGLAGNASVISYVPYARVVAEQDTFAAPTTLIGPEVAPRAGVYGGHYSYSVTIEELF